MRIRILGTPFICGSSGLTGRRTTVLTAMLALNVNKGVSVDRLIDAVWEERPPATAREQVQNCVSTLRRSLADGLDGVSISRHGLGYQLRIDPDQIDAQCFERDLQKAADLCVANRLEAAADTLRRALALWTGPALDGLNAVELRAHANRLDEMRTSATERLIETIIALGRHDEALAELRSLTRLHPLHERYMILLTDTLMHRRRHSEALDAYRAFADQLATETGGQPSAAAGAREQQILRALHRSDSPSAGHDRSPGTDLSFAVLGPRDAGGGPGPGVELLHHLENAVHHIRAAFALLGEEATGRPGDQPGRAAHLVGTSAAARRR